MRLRTCVPPCCVHGVWFTQIGYVNGYSLRPASALSSGSTFSRKIQIPAFLSRFLMDKSMDRLHPSACNVTINRLSVTNGAALREIVEARYPCRRDARRRLDSFGVARAQQTEFRQRRVAHADRRSRAIGWIYSA